MTATKNIDPVALASITTDIIMTSFGAVHEAIEWILGHPVWTHELPSVADTAKGLVRAQFPDMPIGIDDHWTVTAEAVRKHYGETVEVSQGTAQRTATPIETLHAQLGI
jgi:hypothetical protein